MRKNILVTILVITFVFTISIVSEAKSKEYCRTIWINNTSSDDVKIEVLDINLSKEPIYIDKKYKASAILTMEITNKGLYDMELSNIDIYPYQENKLAKLFVKTSNDKVTGFIGNIKSGESKKIKIGVALYNTKDPIKIQLSNIEDKEKEKVIESIRLK